MTRGLPGTVARLDRWRARLMAMTIVSAAASVSAQSWPVRPIRLIIAAPAGSSIDVLGRILAEPLRESLAQAVVVENVPAAGGTVATAAVVRAAPDAHTLGIAFNGPLAFAPFLYAQLAYDPLKDLQPVILTTSQPNVLAVSASISAKSVAELIAYARAQRGKLNYASVGNGSSSHLTMELFKATTGIEATHVPFNGSPPALNALASGDAQLLFAVPTAISPLAQAGKVRMLAVTSARRWALQPELPSIAESGLPGFESFAWNGVIAPAGIAAQPLARLNATLDGALQDPTLRARLHSAGLEPVGGTPGEFQRLLVAEARKWGPIIRKTGVRID